MTKRFNEEFNRTSLDGRDYLFLLAAVAAALLLRLVFFQGVLSIDDFNYLRHAAELWKGRFSYQDLLYLHGTRPLVFVPVSCLFSLFGPSEAAAIAWPLAASITTVVLYYIIARTLFSRECAVYAAAFAAFLPLLVIESTRILPGAIMNLIIAVSVCAFLKSESSRRRMLWLLVSGAAYGAMLLTGELGILFGCFFPIAVLMIGRHRFWSYWPVAAGFIIIAISQVFYQWMETGDPLFKAHISKVILENEVPPVRPFYYLALLAHPFTTHGGVFYLAVIGAFAAVRSRHNKALFTAAWLLVMWLLIEYVSSSLTSYRPIYKYVRYASILALPGVLLSAFGLAWIRGWIGKASLGRAGEAVSAGEHQGGSGASGLASTGEDADVEGPRDYSHEHQERMHAGTRRGTAAVVLILAALLMTSLYTIQRSEKWTSLRHSQLEKLRSYVAANKGKVVYVTHWLWNTRVGYQMGFDDDYFPSGYDPYHAVLLTTADASSKNRYVQTLRAGEAMAPGLLINDETLLAASLGDRNDSSLRPGEIPPVLARPPEEWRLIDRFKVGGNTLALYEIPGGARWPGAYRSSPEPER